LERIKSHKIYNKTSIFQGFYYMCITISLTSLTYIMTFAILPNEDDSSSTLIDSIKKRDYPIS